MASLNIATIKTAIATWVRRGSGLANNKVIWTLGARAPEGAYIHMRIRVGTIGSDMVHVEENPDPDPDPGNEALYTVVGGRTITLTLTCFAPDDLNAGTRSPEQVLNDVLTAASLPSMSDVLKTARIGVLTFSEIAPIDLVIDRALFEPRAVCTVKFHTVASMSETGPTFDTVEDIVGTIDGHDIEFTVEEPPIGGGAIMGVTRDATNLNYYPSTAGEWSLFMTAIGLATGNPSSVWTLQMPSGNALDAIGTVTLTAGAWSYQQTSLGASRFVIKGTDGTTNSRFINSTTAPNPALTSTLTLMYIDFPALPPGGRGIGGVASTNAMLRWTNTGKLRIVAGATTDAINSSALTRQWVALRVNRTAGSIAMLNQQEKLVGTYVLPTSATLFLLGGDGGAAGPVSAAGYGYACEFTGAAAELTDAQVKTLLQGLGATIPWT